MQCVPYLQDTYLLMESLVFILFLFIFASNSILWQTK